MAVIESGLYSVRGEQVALKAVKVDARLVGGFTRVKLRQVYRNEEPSAIEAVYTFPTPSDASLTGFAMECQGRRSEGVVQEREKAFRTYDDAVLSGHGAALLEQERANVFTATVGNVLPHETVTIEVEYVQRVQADEGSLRWMLPTLVAPRYIPGTAAHNVDRTAHGTATPTDRVPDADRISPPTADVSYGITLRLVVDLGREVSIESPSHTLHTAPLENHAVDVSFRRETVALDRDVIVTVRGVGTSVFSTLSTHRTEEAEPGYFACTLVPDLLADPEVSPLVRSQTVVFVIDTSGSMEGDSIVQARSALRLCLRHLREGDRFNVIAFSTQTRFFRDTTVAFTEETLEMADRWVAALQPYGGTEILVSLVNAVESAPSGVVVLLTDGQIANEDEILRKTLSVRRETRVYSFGIGTNVSDWLLRSLAQRTSGAVEFIHPGERIDDKVVAIFARAIAPRVRKVELLFEGVEATQLTPREVPDLVDGEPWTVFGRYETVGEGRCILRGTLAGKHFEHAVPIAFPSSADNVAVAKLWARGRIQVLEELEVESAQRGGDARRAAVSRDRIVELSTQHQVMSKYTSFVVVEKRTGDRRAQGEDTTANTRVIPVNAPAGWVTTPTQRDHGETTRSASFPVRLGGVTTNSPRPIAPMRGGSPNAGVAAPVQRAAPAPKPASDPMTRFGFPVPFGPAPEPPAPPEPSPRTAWVDQGRAVADLELNEQAEGAAKTEQSKFKAIAQESSVVFSSRKQSLDGVELERSEGEARGIHELFASQLASGLWDDPHDSTVDVSVRQYRATARVLLQLLHAQVDTNHTHFGTPLRKALEAMVRDTALMVSKNAGVIGLVLSLGLLLATGARTRAALMQAIQSAASMQQYAQDTVNPVALRARVEAGVRAL